MRTSAPPRTRSVPEPLTAKPTVSSCLRESFEFRSRVSDTGFRTPVGVRPELEYKSRRSESTKVRLSRAQHCNPHHSESRFLEPGSERQTGNRNDEKGTIKGKNRGHFVYFCRCG